jgi:hypothetical protein
VKAAPAGLRAGAADTTGVRNARLTVISVSR